MELLHSHRPLVCPDCGLFLPTATRGVPRKRCVDCAKKFANRQRQEYKNRRYRDDPVYRERTKVRLRIKDKRRVRKPKETKPRPPTRGEKMVLLCSRCRIEKPRGWFHKKVLRNGLVTRRSWCKDCEKPGRAAAASRRRERVVGSYTGQDVERLLVSQRGCCAWCGRSFVVTGYHVDHVIPIARGGRNTRENIQLLCPLCNLRKGVS